MAASVVRACRRVAAGAGLKMDLVASRMIVPPSRLPASLAIRGPGRLGAEGPTGVMIFDAGKTFLGHDMVARFFGEEIDLLHWLEDYLRDRETLNMFARLDDPSAAHEAEGEEEVLYDKKALVDVDNDAAWSDIS
jgi:hypothetical protein